MRFFLFLLVALAHAQPDPFSFDDQPLSEPLQHPDWFKDSFLELDDDLKEAIESGKKGIIVYFGQKRCPYCRQLMEINFKQKDIVDYIRHYFDVIAIDIWSPEEVTLPDGQVMSQREYALKMQTNFTPSLIFYDQQGQIALRLRGYYPPYPFKAALEFVVEGHYLKNHFAEYLALGEGSLRFTKDELVEEDFFIPPPHCLDRRYFAGERPLIVFFEQLNCHACDVLHNQVLNKNHLLNQLEKFDVVQLDMHSDQPLITPDGQKMTAAQWAKQLGLFYAPTLIFFDQTGQEIIRVDSVVRFFRLNNVLNYILEKGYQKYADFQSWRSAQP